MATILVADDNQDVRIILEAMLTSAGHSVLLAPDGAVALAVARAERPDLIITDLLMPTMDGFELVRRLRSDLDTASIKVVFHTAQFLESESRSLADLCGVSQVISKPARREAMMAIINAELGSARIETTYLQEASFLAEHQRILTDKLTRQVAELDAEIAERKRAEAALRLSEARYRRIVETTTDGIWLMDGQWRTEFVNKRVTEMLGWSADEIAGRHVADFFSQASQPLLVVQKERRERGLSDTYEAEFKRRDGTPLAVSLTTNAIMDDEGRFAGSLAMITDIADRKKTQARLQRQIEHHTAVREIDLAISSGFDIRVTLNTILDRVLTQLNADAAVILTSNQQNLTLRYTAGRGLRTNVAAGSRVEPGRGLAGRAAANRAVVTVENLAGMDSVDGPHELARAEGFVSYCAAPLLAKARVEGVIEVYHRSTFSPDADWIEFFETLAGQTAIAVENARLFEDVQRANAELRVAYDATLEGWVRAVDLRDKETEGHTQRVTALTERLATAFGMGHEEIEYLRRGALLHDVGKLGIPDGILQKPGRLDPEEWEIIKLHPVYAFRWLSPIAFLRPSLDIPYCHHERWDGSGYPRGLKAESIPFAARLFSVIDVWDALVSDRVYRPAWSEERVRTHIRNLSGVHFDPRVVEVFLDSEVYQATTGTVPAQRDSPGN